jgi:thioredoxin reductase (NADPH)
MIRNYLGFPKGISGDELAIRAYQQAWQFGTTFLFANAAEGVHGGDGRHVIMLSDGNQVQARAVIVANGASYRRLGIAGLERFVGAGVFYVSVANEAFALGGEHVFVVGAGNSAGQAALHLAKYAERVTLVSRRHSLRETMSAYLVVEIESSPGIDALLSSSLVAGGGDQRLRELTIEDLRTGERRRYPAGALFVMIGADPHTEWLPATVARDDEGYLLTGPDVASFSPDAGLSGRDPLPMESSLPGLFAAGDVRHGSTKRVASAVGEGAMAVASVHRSLAWMRQHEVA